MTVKELKEKLVGVPDDCEVFAADIDDKGIEVVDAEVYGRAFRLLTQQEFPDDWYAESGAEIVCPIRGVQRVTDEEDADLYLEDEATFGDTDEHLVSLRIYDGYAVGDGVRLTFPKLEDLTAEQVLAIDEYCGGRIRDSKVITPGDACALYGKVCDFGIIDTSNGHDPELVRKINIKWMENKDKFRLILHALYERDCDEIYNSDAFAFDKWKSKQHALDDLKGRWDTHAWNYLQHIADDGDLECVINFAR